MKILIFVFGLTSIFVSASVVRARGLMLLYRPLDISTDCAFSRYLRYDLSFGMGMSDTITLVMRTMKEFDYECQIEIVSERADRPPHVVLLVVVRFPNTIGFNCQHNPSAFILIKAHQCYMLCDLIKNTEYEYSNYFSAISPAVFRFQFSSNSSINSDINAHVYEVTATSARKKRENEPCNKTNETVCTIDKYDFCFTSGVVCDGIKHCGADDWFDERKSECERPVQRLGVTPVVAVCALVACLFLATTHILRQCLPPLAESFFIFNTNEDNRFAIDPKFKSPGADNDVDDKGDYNNRKSLIPVDTTSSSEENCTIDTQGASEIHVPGPTVEQDSDDKAATELRKPILRSMSQRIQRSLRKALSQPPARHDPETTVAQLHKKVDSA